MSAKGWECPKCGNVYAPWMVACTRCNRRPISFAIPSHGYTREDLRRDTVKPSRRLDGCT